MAKIRWTEKASKNLQSNHEYISRDSKVDARRFVKALIKATLTEKNKRYIYYNREWRKNETYG